jgi:hypothetical protein
MKHSILCPERVFFKIKQAILWSQLGQYFSIWIASEDKMLQVFLDRNSWIKFIIYTFVLPKWYDPNFHTILKPHLSALSIKILWYLCLPTAVVTKMCIFPYYENKELFHILYINVDTSLYKINKLASKWTRIMFCVRQGMNCYVFIDTNLSLQSVDLNLSPT